MNVPVNIKNFCSIFNREGFSCYLVGGAVRNLIRGINPADFDFATDAQPEDMIKIFRKVIPTGIEHGTVTILFKGMHYEVTTFRIDGNYTNSRHPDRIIFSDSIYEDLKRRDFTINSMALDPVRNKLIDPHNGQQDLKRRIIRAIGDPSTRFSEDGLRVLRGCRFASQLGFDIESSTLAGIEEQGFRLKYISAERIRDEIIKILMSDLPSKAFFIMKDTKILKYVIPELEDGIGMRQREMHSFDVFEHSLYSADFAEKDLVIKLSALLHDIGKPASLQVTDNIPTFYNHDKISARMAGEILRRLKFPKSVEKQVSHLIEEHMFNYTEDWTDSAIRRLIARVGETNIQDLIKLRYADRAGMRGKPFSCANDSSFISRINAILEKENAFSIKNLSVDGNLLSEKAGIPKGPEMGKVLEFLLETVLEDPGLNKTDKLIEIAENFYRERMDLN